MFSSKFLTRGLIYLLAFTLPPFSIGILKSFSSFSEVMIHRNPAPLSQKSTASHITPPFGNETSGKLKAVILLSNAGTQISDLMAAYEVLGESGAFETVTVARDKVISPTTGDLAVMPDYSFEEFANPKLDLLVIPAILNPMDSANLEWVKKAAKNSKLVLSLGEGARLLAKAELFRGHRITSHFLAINDLQTLEPKAKWETGVKWVQDGRLISSAGIKSSIDATLTSVAKLVNPETAIQTAAQLHYPWNLSTFQQGDLSMSSADWFRLLLNAGYRWNKKNSAVIIEPQMHEISIAAILDTLPRSLGQRVNSVASERKILKTLHGLQIVPTLTVAETMAMDQIFIPSTGVQDPALQQWMKVQNTEVVDWSQQSPGQIYGLALQLTEEREGYGMASFVGKLIEASPADMQLLPPEDDISHSWSLWLRVLLVGALGVLIARVLVKEVEKRMQAQP